MIKIKTERYASGHIKSIGWEISIPLSISKWMAIDMQHAAVLCFSLFAHI